MNGEEELLEVYVTVSIFVKVSKDIITELLGVCRQEARAVNVHEGLGREAAVGAILLEHGRIFFQACQFNLFL